jgi:hypothetical protein
MRKNGLRENRPKIGQTRKNRKKTGDSAGPGGSRSALFYFKKKVE